MLVLFGCPPPSGPPPPGGGTISGRVFDYITGEGISGAAVVFGGYSDTTDPVYNIGMCPVDTAGHTERNLSGRIYDSTGNEIADGSWVVFVIFNENGGYSGVGDIPYDKSGGGYSVSSLTFGSDCLVVVTVDDEFGDDLFWFYLTDQDLSTDRANYDLTQPSSGYTTVNLNGTLGTMFQGYLVVPFPPQGMILGCLDGDLFSSSSASAEIYNPNGFLPMMWWTVTGDMDSPGPGDMTMRIHAQQMDFASTITLPSPVTFAGPTETVDGATAGWDGSTLSFDPAAGSDGYIVTLEDDSGYFGMIWLSSSSSVTLPGELVTAVLGPGTGWDLAVMPAAGPDFDPDNILGFALHWDISEGGIPYTEFQAVVVFADDVTKVDIIP